MVEGSVTEDRCYRWHEHFYLYKNRDHEIFERIQLRIRS